jgi:hypothetical protein
VVRRALPARRVRRVHKVREARRAIRGRLVLPARLGPLGRLVPKARKVTRVIAGLPAQLGLKAKQRLPLPPCVYRSKSARLVAAVSRVAGLKSLP